MTDEFSVESVYAELLGRAPENKMEPRLAPLFRAMDVLGEPNKAYPIIHVTGTNGKTSTARMIESVLRAHGLSTGRYTSPHLSKVTERISIDGAPVHNGLEQAFYALMAPVLVLLVASLAPRSRRIQRFLLRAGRQLGEIRGALRLLQAIAAIALAHGGKHDVGDRVT